MAIETAQTTEEQANERRPVETLLIDTDVHETPPKGPGMQDLVPYMDRHWARYMTGQGGLWLGSPKPLSYAAPVNGMATREDWTHDPTVYPSSVLENVVHDLFEAEGVSLAILNGQFFSPSTFPGEPEFAAAIASAYNDYQVAEWLEREPRLCGSVHIAAREPERAAREIDRVAEHPQIVQVILPSITDWEWGDPYYRPIWEAALRNDLVIAFHHGVTTKTALGWPRYYIQWHTMAAPTSAMNQAMSLIVNGTFDRYPELKVAMLEGGVTWVPWLMWRLDAQFKELRSNVPWVKRLPSEHIRANVRASTQPITEVNRREFMNLIEMTQTQDVYMFSTDYPHFDADSANVLDGLPKELRSKIRYQNALDTYPRLRRLLGV
jgi:predicted TIM-barrel fold metal-dependent hydrolase